jgi:hypothetical protein
MEYTIKAEDNLVRAQAWGRDTQHVPPQFYAAILAEARKHDITRILVELTQRIALTAVNQFHLIDGLPSLGITPHCRIALVHHTPGLFEASDMIDIVANNRGLNVRNFRDVDSALAWLG